MTGGSVLLLGGGQYSTKGLMKMRNVDKIKVLQKKHFELQEEIKKLKAYSDTRVEMLHNLMDKIEGYKECMQIYEAFISHLIGLQAPSQKENESGEIRVPQKEITRLLDNKRNSMWRDGDDYVLKVVDKDARA